MTNNAFIYCGSFTVRQIADKVGGVVVGDENVVMRSVGSIESAQADQLTFLSDAKYTVRLKESKAGACLITKKAQLEAPQGMTLVIVDDPYAAFNQVVSFMYKERKNTNPEISPLAVVDSSAKIASSARVEAGVCIEADAVIGEGCVIMANAYIGVGVSIGANATVYPRASISHSKIGANCVIYSGAVIGGRGFGFAFSALGEANPVPHIGQVIIGDDVEIGANTCIDRGVVDDTIIGDKTKIDNLVQIGHNVKIGHHSIICGNVGIAGSSEVGNYVMIGGGAGISGHIRIADKCKVAAMSGVAQSITKEGESVGGIPAVPIMQWKRQSILLAKMMNK